MDHIVNLINKQAQEQAMAKAKIQQPIREVAQIVYYQGNAANVVRYVDMKEAKKQFDALFKLWSGSKKMLPEPFVLTGTSTTSVITNVKLLDTFHLVDVETNNTLMADTQKRMNAMMQLP